MARMPAHLGKLVCGLAERRGVKKSSIDDRIKACADLVNSMPDRPWLIWCDLNAEGEAITAALTDALEVEGANKTEVKTERLLGFCEGRPRVLVTKPKVASFGMNWQHCHSMVFLGLNDSFEQLFQAIRRCWRFGQVNPVDVYMIASELEGAVVANLKAKEQRYDQMAANMVEHMRGFSESIMRGGRQAVSTYEPKIPMELPRWMVSA